MLPDNRIRFSSARIDFADEVGTTGQEHDSYPSPGQNQARFDWMRIFLIGLLSNQSSFDEPTQFREGTIWFDLNDAILKIRRNNSWVQISDAIKLGTDNDGLPISLTNFYNDAISLLNAKPTATFSGHAVSDNVTTIVIPESLRSAGGNGSRPMVWINGLLLDPRKSEYVGVTEPASIRLVGGAELNTDDEFTILMVSLTSNYFHVPEITA